MSSMTRDSSGTCLSANWRSSFSSAGSVGVPGVPGVGGVGVVPAGGRITGVGGGVGLGFLLHELAAPAQMAMMTTQPTMPPTTSPQESPPLLIAGLRPVARVLVPNGTSPGLVLLFY